MYNPYTNLLSEDNCSRSSDQWRTLPDRDIGFQNIHNSPLYFHPPTCYEEEKERYISLIKDELKQGRLTDMERYLIQNRLFAEYNSYISESALHYINENILIATRLNNRQWINSSILNKVHILNTSGLFVEAMELLKSLPRIVYASR